jgi:hypothetical protein
MHGRHAPQRRCRGRPMPNAWLSRAGGRRRRSARARAALGPLARPAPGAGVQGGLLGRIRAADRGECARSAWSEAQDPKGGKRRRHRVTATSCASAPTSTEQRRPRQNNADLDRTTSHHIAPLDPDPPLSPRTVSAELCSPSIGFARTPRAPPPARSGAQPSHWLIPRLPIAAMDDSEDSSSRHRTISSGNSAGAFEPPIPLVAEDIRPWGAGARRRRSPRPRAPAARAPPLRPWR